jgi:hypothetical protein
MDNTNSAAKTSFAVDIINLTATPNSMWPTQIRQRTTDSLRTTQFDSEHLNRCEQQNSAANP